MVEPIVQYGTRCNRCHDRIFSNHRHDFVRCKCGATSIDGGFDHPKGSFDSAVGWGEPITRKLARYPRRGYRRKGLDR